MTPRLLPSAEAGESCSLENYLALPDHTMDERIRAARARLGTAVMILGHHYQRDEVVRFADFTGDSYKLAKMAAASDAKYIVFCGVHFMAESADVLAHDDQKVILPDLNAGCSMADMAEISQVEDCWDALERAGLAGETVPVTYINSTAAIKAFAANTAGWFAPRPVQRRRLVGICARQADSIFAGSASGAKHGARYGNSAGRNGRPGTPGRSNLVIYAAARQRSVLLRAASCFGRVIAPCISASYRAMWTRCARSTPAFG